MSDGFPDRRGYALVTGGAQRIGAALVRRLAEDGWAVAIHCHTSMDKAEALVKEIEAKGGRALCFAFDLAAAHAFADMFAFAGAQFGFCSLLVNNASAFEYDDISNVSREHLEKLFAVNLHAPVLLARDFAAQLPADAHGLIVNLLDQKVFNLNPDFLSYTLTKSSLEAATRLLAQAMAPRVRVCGIAPGLTLKSGEQTAEGFETAHAKTPLGFGSEPEHIAETLSYLTKVPSITGTTVLVDGGQHLQKRTRDVMFTYGIGKDAPVGGQ
jgi:NAD(P)-dependent dehydrogenase (short-subunit alcohol dehydrogenase family)